MTLTTITVSWIDGLNLGDVVLINDKLHKVVHFVSGTQLLVKKLNWLEIAWYNVKTFARNLKRFCHDR